MTMDNRDVREAVALYVHGAVTEAEAARRAGVSRARLRYYVRTCGVVASPPKSVDDSEPKTRS